jgi:hypothetical protein
VGRERFATVLARPALWWRRRNPDGPSYAALIPRADLRRIVLCRVVVAGPCTFTAADTRASSSSRPLECGATVDVDADAKGSGRTLICYQVSPASDLNASHAVTIAETTDSSGPLDPCPGGNQREIKARLPSLPRRTLSNEL